MTQGQQDQAKAESTKIVEELRNLRAEVEAQNSSLKEVQVMLSIIGKRSAEASTAIRVAGFVAVLAYLLLAAGSLWLSDSLTWEKVVLFGISVLGILIALGGLLISLKKRQ